MKKLLLLTSVIPFLSTSVAFAQPEKGSILLGAGIGMGVSPDVGLPRNQIIPKAAYFFTDNFAVGGLLKLSGYYFPDNNLSYIAGVSSFARYYFTGNKAKDKKRMYWFIEVNAGINKYNYENLYLNNSYSNKYLNYGIGGGFNYYITPELSIETMLRIDRNNYLNRTDGIGRRYSLQPAMEIGINYLLKSKKRNAQTN